MILLIIYCVFVLVLTYLFFKDVFKGYFKGYGKLVVISVYIFGCLLWPIGFIIGLNECLLENTSLKRKTEKENKRKMVCEVLDDITIM